MQSIKHYCVLCKEEREILGGHEGSGIQAGLRERKRPIEKYRVMVTGSLETLYNQGQLIFSVKGSL